MKKIFLPFACFLTISISCEQKFETWQIPKKVLHNFNKQYPSIEADWEIEDSVYEAMFKKNGDNITLMYNKGGDLLQSEKKISTADLPGEIKKYIAKNYKDQKITKAKKVTKNDGEINYEVVLGGNNIIFNEEGKFINMMKD